ncbi:hypothetical protein B0H14DRAFT_3171437 [Mycena olivaceomarginata]|nr:hypothetical protein B0H14DRAFT_3171437 [Mycena olivaceomarginata]
MGTILGGGPSSPLPPSSARDADLKQSPLFPIPPLQPLHPPLTLPPNRHPLPPTCRPPPFSLNPNFSAASTAPEENLAPLRARLTSPPSYAPRRRRLNVAPRSWGEDERAGGESDESKDKRAGGAADDARGRWAWSPGKSKKTLKCIIAALVRVRTSLDNRIPKTRCQPPASVGIILCRWGRGVAQPPSLTVVGSGLVLSSNFYTAVQYFPTAPSRSPTAVRETRSALLEQLQIRPRTNRDLQLPEIRRSLRCTIHKFFRRCKLLLIYGETTVRSKEIAAASGVFEPLYVEPASGLRGYELERAEYPSQALLFQVYTAWGVVPNFVTSLRNEKVLSTLSTSEMEQGLFENFLALRRCSWMQPPKRLKLGPLKGWGSREGQRQHECD